VGHQAHQLVPDRGADLRPHLGLLQRGEHLRGPTVHLAVETL
jgi:hypothetical protein